jgi:branched-chain amino acid transport system substrate-binding protein
VAIIGHATSGQTVAGLAVTNPAGVVMLSPTASTPQLSGRKDFFFRVIYSLKDRAHGFAQRIYQGRKLMKIAVIWDTDNNAYSKAFLEAFVEKYRSLGGKITVKVDFSSKMQPDFSPLVEILQKGSPEGLLIIAADMDTALIAQRTHLMGWPIALFTTAWAQTETLIQNGGQTVEGLEIEIANSFNSQKPDYLDFKRRYQVRFGQIPSFGAALGYEAAQLLTVALKKTGGKADGLAQALSGIKNFKGLTDTISMDEYGDAVRPFYLGTIRNGKFMAINALSTTAP